MRISARAHRRAKLRRMNHWRRRALRNHAYGVMRWNIILMVMANTRRWLIAGFRGTQALYPPRRVG